MSSTTVDNLYCCIDTVMLVEHMITLLECNAAYVINRCNLEHTIDSSRKTEIPDRNH